MKRDYAFVVTTMAIGKRKRLEIGTIASSSVEGSSSEQAQLDDRDTELIEVEDIATTTTKSKNTRKKSRCIEVQKLKTNQRIIIRMNKFSEPIKRAATVLSSYIGTMARTSTLCPLNYKKWTDMPETTKKDQFDYLKEKFRYPESLNEWINKKAAKKWRDYKCELKAKYFKPTLSEIENCKVVPDNVVPAQWHFLVKHFLSDEGKALAEIGRNSRLKQKVNHTCGSKAFAVRIDEIEEETGQLVGDIDFYELSHTTKDGNIIDKEAEKILNEAKEILAEFKRENPEATSEELVAKQAEIMSKVKGKEARGRVCGRGLGPSQIEIGLSRDDEVVALRNKVAHLEVQVQNVPKLKGQLEKVLRILEECGINLDDDGSENGEDRDGGNGV